MLNESNHNNDVPIWEKSNLTLKEAANYSGIGINQLRDMSNEPDCDFVLFDTMKLFQYAKTAETLMPQGILDIEKAR